MIDLGFEQLGEGGGHRDHAAGILLAVIGLGAFEDCIPRAGRYRPRTLTEGGPVNGGRSSCPWLPLSCKR